MDESTRMHELLPWYVTGTLEPRLAESFREHLAGCPACREELSMLEALGREVGEHGATFFADHPSPERVVGAARGELAGAEAAEVRKHLALCRTCAEETSWVSGEGAYGEAAGAIAGPSGVPPFWKWAAAALAASMLVSIPWLVLTGSRVAPTGVVPVFHLKATHLGAPRANVFTLQEGQPGILLILQVDFSPASFPLTVTLIDGAGDTVRSQSGISTLLDGYLHYACARRDCPAGEYTLEVHGSGEAEAGVTFDFEVTEP
jgi:anti-sigma factor RsiW